MLKKPRITVVSRRTALLSGAALVLASSALRSLAWAETPTGLERTPLYDEALKAIIGAATPTEGKITLELPELAENGNFVPVTVSVESPMTAEDHVKKIHLLSTANPVARMATFHLSPTNAQARIQSRIRLAKTQDIVAIAELSSGPMAIATATVKVTIGGCQG